MQPDPVVEEVRSAREAYAARFGFDLRAICRDLREKEHGSRRRLVSLPPRAPEPFHAASSPVAPGSRRDP